MNRREVESSAKPKETLSGFFGRGCEISYWNILLMQVCWDTLWVFQLFIWDFPCSFLKKCCCFLLLFYLFVCLLIPVSVTACSTGHVEACPLLLKQWKCFTACRHVNSIITYTIISYSCCYCKCVCTVLSTQIIAYTRRGPTRDWPDTINFL